MGKLTEEYLNTKNTITMKKKMIYTAPETEQMEVSIEEHFLTSVETMSRTSIDGTWDDAD